MSKKRNHRGHKERREQKAYFEFPFVDRKGNFVRFDRRDSKDLRAGILVTRSYISKKEFTEYFEAKKHK